MRKLRAVGKPTADGNIGDRELVACQQLLCGLKALLNSPNGKLVKNMVDYVENMIAIVTVLVTAHS